jgi:hypothetical protein
VSEPRRTSTYLFVREGASPPVRLPPRPDDEPPPKFGRLPRGARIRRTPTPLDPARVSPHSALHFDPAGALSQAIYQVSQTLVETHGAGCFAVVPVAGGEASAQQAADLACELALAACFATRTVLVDAHLNSQPILRRLGLPEGPGLTEAIEGRRRQGETPVELRGVHLGLSVLGRGEAALPSDLARAGEVFADLAGYAPLVFIAGLVPGEALWSALQRSLRAVLLVGPGALIEQVTRKRGPWGDLPLATLAVAEAPSV